MKNKKTEEWNLQADEGAAKDPPEEKDNRTDACELDDDLLEGVSGGLVQLINPSSARP